jgi:hypothetical protein
VSKYAYCAKLLKMAAASGVTGEEKSTMKKWQQDLLQRAAAPQGVVAAPAELPVFVDHVEEEEWSKINGCDADGQKVLANKSDASTPANLYWLHVKYKGIHFVDQNPEDESGSGAPLADESKWEHRVIIRVLSTAVCARVATTLRAASSTTPLVCATMPSTTSMVPCTP